MRDTRSKFASPFETDLPLPMLGIRYQNAANTDFQYCREAINMWVSPAGNLETRPSILSATWVDTEDTTGRPTPIRDGSPVTGVYFSPSFKNVFFSKKKSDGKNYLFRFDPDLDGDTQRIYEVGELTGDNDKVCIIDFMEPTSASRTRVYVASGGVPQYWNGMSLMTQTKAGPDFAEVPELDYITTWTDRLWGFKGYTVYASGYRAPDDWGGATGASTGTNGGYIEVRKGDGADISGFCIFQGEIYLTKAAKVGHQSSFWTITGNSFNASSTNPFSLHLINNGIGCVDPFTMVAVSNSVMFAGSDGRIYSQSSVDRYAYPESTPENMNVIASFTGRTTPVSASFQPVLGYYFIINKESSGIYHDIWAYHIGTKGWWRWHLSLEEFPTCICAGERDTMYIGTSSGSVYRLDPATYGVDGGRGVRSTNFTSTLSFGIIDANSTKDKFFEWLFVDYLPIGHAGQMWVDYKEGRGYTYAYTASALSEISRNSLSVGWDSPSSQWDNPEQGWDMGGTVEVKNRINRRSSTMGVTLSANTPFRLIGIAITGGLIATRDRFWHKGVR